MPNFTEEQTLAIEKDNTNIIVSAGAGSGKTAVLTARVIRKLKQGVPINKLLVLTFTNEAAKEMKNRIRQSIIKEGLTKELSLLDSSYITTFDSFAFSIMKKYHYVLGMPKNISIIDSSIIDLKEKEFLDIIFDDLYKEKNKNFLKLIKDFCQKDDKDLKESILRINNTLEQKIDKKDYLKSYLDNYFSNDYINSLIDLYQNKIKSLIGELSILYEKAISSEKDSVVKSYLVLKPLINSKSYEEIKSNLNIKLPLKVEDKKTKEKIKEIIDKLTFMTTYESISKIKDLYNDSSIYVESIIDIINKLDKMIDSYKRQNNTYEFIDIAKMAIRIVTENKEICSEIKYFYNEIMVDEYQDTNDLQELFISLISNNNVYMVGDIKQSIYRFRNANPMIFKNKYDAYETGNNGFKIDLTKNFRSREEVLNNINSIFDKIMDNPLGGADYKKSHRMIFGNNLFTKWKSKKISNNVDFYNYVYDRNFKQEEIEAFIIANDIKDKIESKYQVFDTNKEILRDVRYSDFCIIMDRASVFDLYKKVFEYLSIPLSILKDEKLTASSEILTLKNIIKFIIKIKKEQYDTEFKYLYTSIARSFLFRYADEDIFDCFVKEDFRNNSIYNISKSISDELDNISLIDFIDIIIEKFNFYNQINAVTDINNILVRILYLKKMCKSLEDLSYTPYDLEAYLTDMIDNNQEIEYKINGSSSDAVKIMTVHKSKGLEFPICYYSGLYKEFNIKDIGERFMYDKTFGIITPYYKEGIGVLPSKIMAKENYMEEEISEKIRLLYVALTRAKEKIIFVAPLNDDIYTKEETLSISHRLKYKSFLDIVNDIKDDFDGRIKNIDYSKFITKDYQIFKDFDINTIESGTKLDIKNVNIDYELENDSKFSKNVVKLLSKNEKEVIEKGLEIHSIFENEDLNSSKHEKVLKLLSHPEFKDIKNSKIYQEYEFMYEKENINYHGIIDLMLEYNDHIDIIDYKLSNIDDENYIKQLEGYKKYIESKSKKEVNIYLYSIEKDELRKILSSFYC